jgi:hypothetical protein
MMGIVESDVKHHEKKTVGIHILSMEYDSVC